MTGQLFALAGDLRHAVRTLRATPWFTLAAVSLLAAGIGGNTSIFSLANAILFRPVPGLNADGLVNFQPTRNGVFRNTGHSYPNYRDYARQSKTLQGVTASQRERFTIASGQNHWTVNGSLVSANYFRVLQVPLPFGGGFEESPEGQARAAANGLPVVVSETFWRTHLRANPAPLGQQLDLNGIPVQVAGVAPAKFRGTVIDEVSHVWVPLEAYYRASGNERFLEQRDAQAFLVMGRLADGKTLQQADAELQAISANLSQAYPKENREKGARVLPYSALGIGASEVRLFFHVMLAVAGLALLVVCANVANLMLSRSIHRQREIAIRQAIGAASGAIYRMLLAEGLILAITAFAAACLFTMWSADALVRIIPASEQGVQIPFDFSPDWRVALYGLLLAIISSAVFTLAPAVRLTRQDALPVLARTAQSVFGSRTRLGQILSVVQLALCVVLLVGAGLLYRSLHLLHAMDPKFRTENVLLASLDTGRSVREPERLGALWDRLREGAAATPGVESVSVGRIPPLAGMSMSLGRVEPVGRQARPAHTAVNYVSAGYLKSLEIPLLQGREFNQQESPTSPKTVIVNEALARELWPGQPAVGQSLQFVEADPKVSYEVIGVARNATYGELSRGPDKAEGFLYLPYVQHLAETRNMTLHIAYRGDTTAIALAIRAAAHRLEPGVPIYFLRTLAEQREETLSGQRMMSSLMSIFGIGSVFLAGIGLYSIVAFQSACRVREFGLRVALGARPAQVLTLVARDGSRMILAGLAIGFALSLAAAQVLSSLLYGISSTDPLTFGLVFLTLAGVSLAALLLPAWRSSRVDPMIALRQD